MLQEQIKAQSQTSEKEQQSKIQKGKHLVQCGGSSFTIYDHYEPMKLVGNGAYGVVVSAYDKKRGINVAIKKVKNVFNDLIDAKRILREIKLLQFCKQKSIVSLQDIIKPDKPDFEDIYLVFELMQSDLEKVINSGQVLTDAHINFFMYQIISGICYLHSANIIHRDLKPNNLLVNKNCQLKIGDFNLARSFERNVHFTDYVVTRWYRAPEIMISTSEYTKAIDIWSIGCIFAELLGRTPIFQGKNILSQMQCIIAILGTPQESDLPYQMDAESMNVIKNLPKRDKVNWGDLFPNANKDALDLLDHMLVYNPKERYTAEQCLNHAYFANKRKQEDIVNSTESFDFAFDTIELEKQKIQQEIFNEAKKFHPDSEDIIQQESSQLNENLTEEENKTIDDIQSSNNSNTSSTNTQNTNMKATIANKKNCSNMINADYNESPTDQTGNTEKLIQMRNSDNIQHTTNQNFEQHKQKINTCKKKLA